MTQKYHLQEFNYVNQFTCLADKCEDQCCSGWRVSVNDEVIEKYKIAAPEVYERVSNDDKGPKFTLLENERRDCMNLEDKLCTIYTKYGNDFLPNTCYFFPRKLRYVGDKISVSATISCPEIVRLSLYGDNPFSLVENRNEERLPHNIYDVKPEGTSNEGFEKVMLRFLAETERDDLDAEAIVLRIAIVSKMLDDYDINAWPTIIDSLFELADYQYIPPPSGQFSQIQLLQFLSEMKDPGALRYDTAFAYMQNVFYIYVNRNHNIGVAEIHPFYKEAYKGKAKAEIDRLLKRFIASEIACNLFPYAWCDSDNPFEKAAIIVMNFAIARLCLLSKIDREGNPPSQEEVVRSIQGIFRSQNHLTRNKVDFYKERGFINLGMLSQVLHLQ